jgi:hypothetical protein
MSDPGLADVAVNTHRSIVSSLGTNPRLSTIRLMVGVMSTSNSQMRDVACILTSFWFPTSICIAISILNSMDERLISASEKCSDIASVGRSEFQRNRHLFIHWHEDKWSIVDVHASKAKPSNYE